MKNNLELKPFQVEGVRFLTSGYHKLLADDMGLGKTVQGIYAAFNILKAKHVLIICPSSVKYQWAREILTWADERPKMHIVLNGKNSIPPQAEVIIVNYELLNRPKIYKQLLARGAKKPYDVCICDEAHYLKSLGAKRTKRVLGKASFLKHTKYKWMFTGTPILNRPLEFFPMLRTLAPETIEPHINVVDFGLYFCNGKRNGFGWDFKGASNADELNRRVTESGFMLRRKKEDVLDQLPAKTETIIELPDVVEPVSVDDAPIATVRRELAIAKIPAAKRFITNMLSETDKIVVFAHHRNVLETLHKEMDEFGTSLIYGGFTATEKQKQIDQFISNDDTKLIFMQTQAGGIGIDGLQTVCNYIVFLELDWSPGIMDQAIDRLRRIGQHHPVFVYYLAVPDSIDVQIRSAVKTKRKIINKVMKGNTMTEDKKALQHGLATLTGMSIALQGLTALFKAELGIAEDSGTEDSKPDKPEKAEKSEPKPKKSTPKKTKDKAVVDSAKNKEDVLKALGAYLAPFAKEDRPAIKDFIKEKHLPEFGGDINAVYGDNDKTKGFIEVLSKGHEFYKSGDSDEDGDDDNLLDDIDL